MKAFALWSLLCTGSFAALAGGYHATLDSTPHRVAVVIDTSYETQRALPGLLRQAQTDFADARYTEVGVFSEKSRLAKDARGFPSVSPRAWAPRDFKRLADGPLRDQLDGYDRVLVYTNASTADVSGLPDSWQIVNPR